MGTLRTAMWLGAASAMLGGCAPTPVYYPAYNYKPAVVRHNNNYNIPSVEPFQQEYLDNSYGFYPASYQRAIPQLRPVFPSRFNSYRPQSWQPGYQTFNRQAPADAPVRRALLAESHRALGIPYRLGGETPTQGFDCSGLVQYVYKHAYGKTLPRTAAEQSQASRTISFEQMRPGDLIFFRTSGSKVNHVGIYTGRGNFIHAASGGGRVTTARLADSYWRQRLVKFGTFMS